MLLPHQMHTLSAREADIHTHDGAHLPVDFESSPDFDFIVDFASSAKAAKEITIIVSTVFQDAGDATRAIEIAKSIRKYTPAGFNPRIVFISHGSRFEQKVIDCGFEIYHAEPKTAGIGVSQDYQMTMDNFIGEKHLAKQLIEGEINAYEEIKPDVVLFGFWPIAGLAYRMVERRIIGICYAPLPVTTEDYLHIIPDIPEHVRFYSMFPFRIRKWLLRYFPSFIKRRRAPLRQPNILWAASAAGWKGKKLVNLFDMLKADLTVVNDLPDYYWRTALPETVIFTGPLFARSSDGDCIDPPIRKIFDARNRNPKIFCTLGSSGNKAQLLEVVKAFTYGEGLAWDAVILSPISVCPIEEARRILGRRPGVYITDAFVPAQKVNALADIVICHGGQGTVQTALHSGTPLVGVATQAEQFMNLYNVQSQGAGIRIPMNKWNAKNIQQAVHTILADKNFKQAAMRLQQRIESMDGATNCAKAIWKEIVEDKGKPWL